MIKCEYCETETRSNSGMASHVRGDHTDKWKGSVKASFSEGYDAGAPEAGRKKKRYPSDDPEYRKRKYDDSKEAKKLRSKKDGLEDPRAFFNNCPNCGWELLEHYLAAGVARRRREQRLR